MIKLSKPLVVLLLLGILSSSCARYKVSDFEVDITLPASQDCYGFRVLSGKETRLPKDSKECKDKTVRSVRIDYENYKILKRDILKNCHMAKCKQITGAFDELFFTIDSALQDIEN